MKRTGLDNLCRIISVKKGFKYTFNIEVDFHGELDKHE